MAFLLRGFAGLLLLAKAELSFPTPPKQTADQVEIFQKAKARAKAASEAATPEVLAFFDETPFREMLKSCCPAVAQLSASELLQRYRAEAQTAELAHALPAKSGGQRTPDVDVTIAGLSKMKWFPNEFQLALMNGKNSSSTGSDMSDVAMQEIFGCKAFAQTVPTWEEASSRLIYVAHNLRRLDTGSEPHFGDFTVIFNSSSMKDSVLIAPYDTGLYTMSCLHPELHPGVRGVQGPPGMQSLNCSAWSKDRKVDVPVGTLDYLDHLIIPNLWSVVNTTANPQSSVWDTARGLFSRSSISEINYEDVPGLTNDQRLDYFESDVLANPRLPEDVKFGVGSFANLFGTAEGRKLQELCLRYEWPLFWAYGVGLESQGPYALQDPPQKLEKMNRRMADPANIVRTSNATLGSGTAAQFEKVWKNATEVRASREVTDEDLLGWWNSLDEMLRVAPISASSCAQPQHCVAVDLTKKDCICKLQSQIFVV